MMKGNNQIFHNNFPEDKMTQSVKLADYRGSAHEAHLQHFEKYAGGSPNQDNNDQIQDRDDKISPREGIDLASHTRQIKTEYSQVSHIESGFQKSKTNQAEMLKELRSQYDHLKKLPLDREQERAASSNSNSRQDGTSEVASSIPTSKNHKRHREVKRDRDYEQREERIWIVEKKQYEAIVASCQKKIEELLHAEMTYKRTIHELRSSMVTPKTTTDNKAEQKLIKELQNALKEQKEKNKLLQLEVQKVKNMSRQQNEKTTRLESEFTNRTRQIYQYEEDKRKLQDLVRLEREKHQNSEIEKRKYQMQFEILRKDKDIQVNRLLRLIDHENVVAEMHLKSETKRFQEEIQLKDRRYRLLLEEYEKLKKDANEKNKKEPQNGAMLMFDQIKNLIQQNRNNQNQQFTRTMNILISRMEEERHEVDDNGLDLENQRLKAEIRILRHEVDVLNQRLTEDTEMENMRKFYESEIRTMQDVVNLLQKKLKEKQNIPVSKPSSPTIFNGDSAILQRRISQLEAALAESQSMAADNEKTYLLYKGKWEEDENQLRSLKRKVDEVTFELERCAKQFQFQQNMIKTEHETTLRMMRADLDKTNGNLSYWRKQFESMKAFYQAKIAQKNRLIEESSNTTSVEEIKRQYDRNFQIARTEYENQIAKLTEKVANHPSYSIEYEELRKKHTQLEMIYFDLKNNSRKSWQLNQGIDHLWGIKETQYGNVNQILRQVKSRPSVTYATRTLQRPEIINSPEFRQRQTVVQAHEEPQFILRQSSSPAIITRNSGYEPPLGAVRQSGYGVRQPGYNVRESGSGLRASGYEGRNSGSEYVRQSGYAREPGYGGIRMSSPYEPPRQLGGYGDQYMQRFDGYPDERFNQYEQIQGGYVRESGRHSGYQERAPEGFRVRESSGFGNIYPVDYGIRQSMQYDQTNPREYVELRESSPYPGMETPAPPPPLVGDPRVSSGSYLSGIRESGYGHPPMMDAQPNYIDHSVYESYPGRVEAHMVYV